MKTGKNQFRLLVLVPHRDARLPLRAWSAALFAAGTSGWIFPGVAPLAELNRPLASEELKSLARALRRHISENGGIVTPGPPTAGGVNLGGKEMSVFGPAVHIELPDDFFAPAAAAVSGRIMPLIIGSALLCAPPPQELPAPPPVSFRAAALANMICRMKDDAASLDDGLLEWKISPLSWLPKNT